MGDGLKMRAGGSPSVHLEERIDLPIPAAVPHQALAGDVKLWSPVDTRTFKVNTKDTNSQKVQM